MADIFDQIHSETKSGDIFDQIHSQAAPAVPITPPTDTAHTDIAAYRAEHPNIKPEDISPLGHLDHPAAEEFQKNHPYIAGAIKMLFNDATPAPGIMAVEGPLGAAVQAATKAGGPSAGTFVSDILSHPKTQETLKDVAREWLKKILPVDAAKKTAKAVGDIREVLGDVREANAPKSGLTIQPEALRPATTPPAVPVTPAHYAPPVTSTGPLPSALATEVPVPKPVPSAPAKPNVSAAEAQRMEISGMQGYASGKPGISIEADPNLPRLRKITYRDAEGKPQGRLTFYTNDAQTAAAPPEHGAYPEVYVNPGARRTGIATQMYDVAKQHGFDLSEISGKETTPAGAAFVNARKGITVPLDPVREAAVTAKGAASIEASRPAIVQKLGKALLDQNFTEENFKVLDKNPDAAKIFWKGLGTKLHERGYMPSEDTIAAIRKYVTAARGLQEEATKTSIGQMMTEKVE